MAKLNATITRRALRIQQVSEHAVYMFALTGEEILKIAEISRLARGRNGELIGYQRPEVKKHIQNIVDYLNSDEVLFPNSIILAMSSKIVFSRSRGPKGDDGVVEAGTISIPLPKKNEAKPAWIVDGQQRVCALSHSRRNDLLVPVTIFIADDVATQRDQFLRINSAKPLPRGLITELLPEITTILPTNLAARKIPSSVCDFLNKDMESPFCGLIRRPSMTREERRTAVVSDTSIIKMVEDSLDNPSGCLFAYRNIGAGTTDFESMIRVIYLFWGAVKDTFPEAWGKKPTQSRLMHGAGIRAMGKLMDRMIPSIDVNDKSAGAHLRSQMQLIKPSCHWIRGNWDELGGLAWNGIQNTPSHIKALAGVLVRAQMNIRRSA